MPTSTLNTTCIANTNRISAVTRRKCRSTNNTLELLAIDSDEVDNFLSNGAVVVCFWPKFENLEEFRFRNTDTASIDI